MARPQKYPKLAELLGGWFHQDFDVAGDSVADVVALFRQSSRSEERRAIAKDIETFLAANDGPADMAFRETFNPDIDPAGFGKSAREWLVELQALLADS